MNNYQKFLAEFDNKLLLYFQQYSKHLHCKKGCSECCEKGDYPLSETELKYLMLGYSGLDNPTKIIIQKNIKTMKKNDICPFLINKECSIYNHRPIICRVHGLAYFFKDKIAKIPYCVNNNKNFSKVYDKGELTIKPINENLDTTYLSKKFNLGEVRNLYDWLN